jgi:hypothetical protein
VCARARVCVRARACVCHRPAVCYGPPSSRRPRGGAPGEPRRQAVPCRAVRLQLLGRIAAEGRGLDVVPPAQHRPTLIRGSTSTTTLRRAGAAQRDPSGRPRRRIVARRRARRGGSGAVQVQRRGQGRRGESAAEEEGKDAPRERRRQGKGFGERPASTSTRAYSCGCVASRYVAVWAPTAMRAGGRERPYQRASVLARAFVRWRP